MTLGAIGNTAAQAIELATDTIQDGARNTFAHYDMRWLKPLDESILRDIAEQFDTVVTIEDGVINGGLGSAVTEWMNDHAYKVRVVRLGVNDQFVEHGSTQELYQLLKLDKEGICESLLQALEL